LLNNLVIPDIMSGKFRQVTLLFSSGFPILTLICNI
jgi:hypothetical protein